MIETKDILSKAMEELEIIRDARACCVDNLGRENRECQNDRVRRVVMEHLFIASNHISQFQGPPAAELVSELAVVRYKNDAMFHAQVDHMANAILTIL